jgi:DNA-binding SARP family transcriptional activator
MQGEITVSLTGSFAIREGAGRRRLHIAGNTKRLLMLLAANFNHGLRRASLIADIWPRSDAQHGSSALNSALWRLKLSVNEIPGLKIHCIDDIVYLSVNSPAVVDVAVLQQAVERTESMDQLGVDDRAVVRRAVKLCNGPFLDGCEDHWALPMRERHDSNYIRALLILMRDAARQRAFERAIQYGREALNLDPFREGTQRDVMRLYVQNGQRVKALRQYEVLRQLLDDDFAIEPMPETVELYKRIRGNDFSYSRYPGYVLGDRDRDQDGSSRPTIRT